MTNDTNRNVSLPGDRPGRRRRGAEVARQAVGEEPGQEAGEEFGQVACQEAGEEAGEEAGQEAGQEAGEERGQEAGEGSGEIARQAASQAAYSVEHGYDQAGICLCPGPSSRVGQAAGSVAIGREPGGISEGDHRVVSDGPAAGADQEDQSRALRDDGRVVEARISGPPDGGSFGDGIRSRSRA